MKRTALVTIALFAGLSSACGFHLRDISNFSSELTRLRLINVNLNGSQLTQLSEVLVKAGASLMHSDANNPAELRVAIYNLPARNLADDAATGKKIVQLTKQLRYSVKKAGDADTLPARVIQRQVNIEQDSNNLLGSESEKQAADEALELQLFNQLIFHLQRL